MKKTRFFIIVLCALIAVFSLVACTEPGAPDHAVSSTLYVVKASSVEQKLEEYVTLFEDRTSGSEGEAAAADYLKMKLESYGLQLTPDEDSTFTYTENNKTKSSRNVSAKYIEDGATKNVIIGAYYDNCYGLVLNASSGPVAAEGVLSNGSGVAAVLAIAEYLGGSHEKLGFNVTIAFFGSSAVGDVGANVFYKKMSRAEKENTVLMVEMQRLGVDHVYSYSGPDTLRESFFNRVAKDNEYNIYKTTQKTPHIVSIKQLNGVPYYEWAQTGVYTCFYNGGIPTLNVVGANWETISLLDEESSTNPNIAFTSSDTLSNFKRLYPHYGSKIALAASFMIVSLHEKDFLSVMTADKKAFNPSAAITKDWIWGLVLIGALVIAYIVMNVVVKQMGKKYPVQAPQPKKIKMAVFGVDYEDGSPNDIFIDFADPVSRGTEEEIFPGIPNNDGMKARSGTLDDIFPPFTAEPRVTPERSEPTHNSAYTNKPDEKSEPDTQKPDGAQKPSSNDVPQSAPQKDDVDGKAESAAPTTQNKDDESGENPAASPVEKKTAATKKTTEKRTALTEKTSTKRSQNTGTKKSTTKGGLTGSSATTGKSTTKKTTAKKPTETTEEQSGDDK